MELVRIAALLVLVAVMAGALDTPWLCPAENELPRVYLSVDRIRPYDQYGSITIMEKDTMRDIGVLVRKRGNTTLSAEKESFNIQFWKKASILDMEKNDRWLLLGMPFDKTMIRTPLGFEYGRALGIAGISQTRFCELYVRNKYRGLYILCEPVTSDGLYLDKASGDCIIERNLKREKEGAAFVTTQLGLRFELNAEIGLAQQCLDAINRAEEAISTCKMDEYAAYIDVDSFVNMYIAQEVIKCIDFGYYSDRYYVRDGILCAGPLWDLDLSMGNVAERAGSGPQYGLYNNIGEEGDGSQNSTRGFWAQRDWYQYLCRDPEFMDRVAERWKEVYPITENLIKNNELGRNRIDELVDACAQGIEANYDEERAWNIGQRYSSFETRTRFNDYSEAIEHLRGWLEKRILWLDGQFGLMNDEERIE